MSRLTSRSIFFVAALVASCGSKETSLCSIENAFQVQQQKLSAAAKSAYEPPSIDACPEVDAPLDGQASSIGLTAGEYASLLRGANGNFFDDHLWWVKARPRGETHVVPLRITAEHCDAVTFEKFGYEYRFATPPLTEAPECGRYLTGIAAGHQLGDSWPQVFSLDGSGLIQVAPLSKTSEWGAFLRAPRAPSATPGRDTSIDQLDVVRHDGDSLELVALANGVTFSSVSRLVLKVGELSKLSVQVELEPRATATDDPWLAVAALSDWFSDVQGRQFDRIRATFTDGTSFEVALADPDLDWGHGEWTQLPTTQGGATLDSLAFLQDRTRAEGNLRPNVVLSNIESNLPIAIGVALTTESVLGGNVVADLRVDSSAASAAGARISVAYLATVSAP